MVGFYKKKKLLRLLRLNFLRNIYANLSGVTKNGSLLPLYKYLAFIRYDRFISCLFKNLFVFRSFLGVLSFTLLKYGVFCCVSVHVFLFKCTRVILSWIREKFVASVWLPGTFSNYKFVTKAKLFKIKIFETIRRIPSVVYVDSLKTERVVIVLKECHALGIPSFNAIETDLLTFYNSYFLCGNSSNFIVEILIGILGSAVSKVKNKKYFSLFSLCLQKEFFFQKGLHIKFLFFKFNSYFYFCSVKKALKLKISKFIGQYLKLNLFSLLHTSVFFLQKLKMFEKKKRNHKFLRKYIKLNSSRVVNLVKPIIKTYNKRLRWK